jgi:uncharacterized SAM-binding protein YcdF (DUF218 family)
MSDPDHDVIGEKTVHQPVSSLTSPLTKHALFGLFDQKPRWSLSLRGWFFLVAFLATIGVIVFFGIHPFLSPTERLTTDIMVVEGWVHKNVIQAAAAEFTNSSYHRVFVTGGPVHGSSGYVNDFNTSASVGADLLKAAGLSGEVVQMVPCRNKDRDRTYSAAIALRDWLHTNNVSIRRVNVVTEGVHARRSRLLFREALGPEISVGIISVPDEEYPPTRWWRYSEGVKDVISEAAAYIYARLFFHPDK